MSIYEGQRRRFWENVGEPHTITLIDDQGDRVVQYRYDDGTEATWPVDADDVQDGYEACTEAVSYTWPGLHRAPCVGEPCICRWPS